MGSIEGRIRRLERRGSGGRRPKCGLIPGGHGRVAVINEEHAERGFDGDPDERCGRCGRPVYTVFRVVYDGEEGGGGLT